MLVIQKVSEFKNKTETKINLFHIEFNIVSLIPISCVPNGKPYANFVYVITNSGE